MEPITRRTLIVDANNLLYRAGHAAARQDGVEGPLFGDGAKLLFLRNIRKLIMTFSMSRCFVVWDGMRSSRREGLFSEYKSGRGGDHDEIKRQMHVLIASIAPLLRKIGCRVILCTQREADDVIYLIVKEIGGGVVASSDRDMYQLVTLGASIVDPSSMKFLSGEFFKSEIGADPDCFLLARVMSGDRNDNIGGVRGVGLTTAYQIIKKVEEHLPPPTKRGVEWLISGLNLVPPKRRGKREKDLLEGADTLRRNAQLMDLSLEVFADHELDKVRNCILSESRFEATEDDVSGIGEGELGLMFAPWSAPFRMLM